MLLVIQTEGKRAELGVENGLVTRLVIERDYSVAEPAIISGEATEGEDHIELDWLGDEFPRIRVNDKVWHINQDV